MQKTGWIKETVSQVISRLSVDKSGQFSPLRLLITIAVSIFIAEVLVMIVVYFLPPLPYSLVVPMDAGIMLVMIFPFLYFFSFLRLIQHIELRRQAENKLRKGYEELEMTEMTAAQRQALLDLVGQYIGNMREGHARVRMDEVKQHLDRTWFAWIGGTDATSVFYYRIHSPVVLIEFDHPRPANLRHLAANPDLPNREHVHVVVRTPNGNDYGKDLLRQHYAQHKHSANP